MTTVAIIPARGGSKRLPRKNIRILDGQPLIAYTIHAALESGCFDRVCVSTDDEEIAEISRAHGAEIPFVRDASLADDVSPVSQVIIDALQRIGGQTNVVAQLMPNCPFRNSDDIAGGFEAFNRGTAGTQLSVTSYGWLYPWWAHRQGDDGALVPLFPKALVTRSQDLERLLCPTGAIWWAKTDVLLKHGTFYAPGYSGFEIPWDRALDIDDEDDWKMAEALIQLKSRE